MSTTEKTSDFYGELVPRYGNKYTGVFVGLIIAIVPVVLMYALLFAIHGAMQEFARGMFS